MKKGKIVIVEGTSCVGKTTLCKNLQGQGWIVIPEAIRFLEKETNKIGDEASPVPILQQEEEYYQDQLFRIEKFKILKANELRNKGKNVVIDKSAIATIATAKVFEDTKKFKGTFKRAYMKYVEMINDLKNKNLIECDKFLLLTTDYETILNRNKMRSHILEGVWLEEKTINTQREVLEKLVEQVVGSVSVNNIEKKIIDTTDLTKEEILKEFNKFVNKKEKYSFER